MNNKLKFLFLGVICLFLTGCISTFDYKVPANAPVAKYQYDCTVAVQNFKDERPLIGGSGKMWYSLIPLMPFGWGFYNRPEDGKQFLTISGFKFNPSSQLAKAAEKSLEYSRLFKGIYYIDYYTDAKPDFIFTGIIKSTLYRQKIFTYCLSFAGPVLWLFGAPEGWIENQLEIDFILKSVKSNKTVWEYTTKYSMAKAEWFYYQGQDVRYYMPIMQKCMNEAINNLQKYIEYNPERFDERVFDTSYSPSK